MKKKGFTLIELLVVIAIIALLMGILMPALARVRKMAQQVVCGTNLKGIGTAVQVFAGDFNQKYPKPNNDIWGPTAIGEGTITSAFYKLINNGYTNPDQFICKSDGTTVPLELSNFSTVITSFAQGDDFGDKDPRSYCSYAYHCPFGQDALSPESDPGMALAADWNPFLGNSNVSGFDPASTDSDLRKAANCEAHEKEGQNVLFNDIHVKFHQYSFCALHEDNIYTFWAASGTEMRRSGIAPTTTSYSPVDRTEDTVLLNEREDAL